MRSVVRGPCPAVLDGPGSLGGQEVAAASTYYSAVTTGAKAYPHKVYGRPEVRNALEAMFHGKCAYCETYYGASQPQDVEHYRPKGGIVNSAGQSLRPGYHWLAADWSNLLPACIDCNRERGQLIDGKPVKSGKGEKFPLLNEASRAQGPGGEARELPVLLDPCRDPVEQHLTFSSDGAVAPAVVQGTPSYRGAETIRILGLRRRGLMRAREERAIVVRTTVRHVRQAIAHLNALPADPGAFAVVERELSELRRLIEPESPYAVMARQLVARELPMLPL